MPFQVSKTTKVHALGGTLYYESAYSQHQLMFAWGTLPINIAIKAAATARKKLALAGTGRDLLLQPTLRSRWPAVALDVFRVEVMEGEGEGGPCWIGCRVRGEAHICRRHD